MSQRTQLVRRSFDVDAELDRAWQHLARVEAWPSWAHHISAVTLEPSGPLTQRSEGRFRLRNGIRTAFRVTEFEPPRRWLWVGCFLTTRVQYDHHFEPSGPGRTRLTWTVDASGPGSRSLGRLFASTYNRNLDRAIPNLQEEFRSMA